MKRYNRKLYPTILHRIIKRIVWLFEWFCNFVIGLFRYGMPLLSTKKFIKLKTSDSLVIIANGPSINTQADEIINHKKCDYACMNYYPLHSEAFEKLKPIYYFGVDTMLYDKNHPDDGKKFETKRLREKMQHIPWSMIAFMYKDESLMLENPFIREVRLTDYMIDGVYSKFRGWLFDHNLAMPKTNTVASLAILTGIRMGYKKIYTYGIDMSQFEDIEVDENNMTINKDRHFYQGIKGEKRLENDIVGVCEASYNSLRAFRTLNNYAKSRGCKIYNCSNHSYVDAFERRHCFVRQNC